jgi:ArsR family transcriptional regulator
MTEARLNLPTPTDLGRLDAAAGEASQLLKALSNRDRLLLLCQLTQEELSVGMLEARTGIRQPTLSQQLTVLREEGLVATRRAGKQVFYRIASRKALAVLQLLTTLYCPSDEEPLDEH